MFTAVALIAAALIALATLLVGSVAVRRIVSQRDRNRADALTAKLRPQVIDFVTGDDEAAPVVDPSDRRQRMVITELLATYGRLLRGQPHERIRTWLADSGELRRARADLRARPTKQRRAAATLLGSFGGDEDVPALWSTMLTDRQAAVRITAMTALSTLASPTVVEHFTDLPETMPLPDLMIVDALRRLAVRDGEPLAAACRAGPAGRRQLACDAVALVGAADASPLAAGVRVAAQPDQPPAVRASALRALAALRADTGQVEAGLYDADPVVLSGALRAAASLADPRYAARCAQLLELPPPVAILAAQAYVACGGDRRDTAELVEAADLAA